MQNLSLPVYTLKTWKFENIHSMTVKFCMHRKKNQLDGVWWELFKIQYIYNEWPTSEWGKASPLENSHVNPSLTFFEMSSWNKCKGLCPQWCFLQFLGSGSSRRATSLGRGLFSLQWSDIFIPLWSFISLLWGGSSSAAVQLWTLLLIAEIKIKTVCQL